MIGSSAMKKFTVFILAFFAIAAIFCGCGKSKKSSSGKDDDEPQLTRSARNASVNNLKQISLAIMMYTDDFEGYLPAAPGLLPYCGCTDTKEFLAPWDEESVKAEYNYESFSKLSSDELHHLITPLNTSYVWLVPPNMRLSKLSDPSQTPFVFEKPWLFPKETDKIAVAYANGIVETKKIPGVSEMSCYRITEKLTENITDQELRKKLLKRAEYEDYCHETADSVNFILVKYECSSYGDYSSHDFPEYMEHVETENGKTVVRRYIMEAAPAMTVTGFKEVKTGKDEITGNCLILLTFNNQDAETFARVTRNNTGRQMAIVIGGKIYCAPRIIQEITNGSACISGTFSKAEAEKIVSRLNKNKHLKP